MFYKTQLKDHIRIPPHIFGLKLEEAMIERIKKKYDGYISKELGIVIDVSRLDKIGEGIIIPGDGASYYETEFEVIIFKPEMQEVVLGRIKDIADFGAFINIGPIDGMIHISQTMNDFVSFNKEKTLAGKESKKVLKIGDKCRARIIATSYKDPANPKLGLTMRQTGLGKFEWIEEQFGQKENKKTEKKVKKKRK